MLGSQGSGEPVGWFLVYRVLQMAACRNCHRERMRTVRQALAFEGRLGYSGGKLILPEPAAHAKELPGRVAL